MISGLEISWAGFSEAIRLPLDEVVVHAESDSVEAETLGKVTNKLKKR